MRPGLHATPPEELLGQSTRPLAEGRPVDAWRDHLVTETKSGRMLRTARHKYILYESGKHREQLIDLETDPDEMQNLAENPRHAETLNAHRELLKRWIERTDDVIGREYLEGI